MNAELTSNGSGGARRSRARRVCGWLAAAVAAFAIYASLIPFEFRAVPIGDALVRFERIMFSSRPERTSRTNYLANALLFVPIGFGIAGAFLAERPGRARLALAAPAALAISLGVSATAEFLQIFTPRRIVSRADVTAQTLGTIGGLAVWLAAGEHLVRWLRAASDRQRGDRVARALGAYAVVWSVVKLAPFDLTVDLGAIASRYRRGLISLSLLPPEAMTVWQVLWDVLATALSAAPLGALGLVGWTGLGARRRSRAAFAVGAAFVVAVEGAQVFIRSHAAQLADVLWGLAGVAIGVWAGRRALRHRQAVAALPARAISWRAVAALAAWCGVLAVYHLQPFDFTADAEMIRAKLNRISLVPFVGYWSGSELNTFENVLVKLALAVPFGMMAAFAADTRIVDRRIATAATILAAVAVFAGLEVGQLLLPSRTADPTDVLVSVAGAAAGLAAGRWLRT